jgi:ankyrin repeat protein
MAGGPPAPTKETHIKLRVTVREQDARAGKIVVKTPDGPQSVSLPAGAFAGQQLVLNVPRGGGGGGSPGAAAAAPSPTGREQQVPSLIECCRTGDSAGVRRHLAAAPASASARTAKGGFPLATAAEEGHEEVVRLLLDAGAPPEMGIWRAPNVADAGATALLLASRWGHAGCVAALLEAQPELARQAVAATAGDRLFPLAAAAQGGHTEVVESLLLAQADPNYARPSDGRTAALICAGGGARGGERSAVLRSLGLLRRFGGELGALDEAKNGLAILAAQGAAGALIAFAARDPALAPDSLTRPNKEGRSALFEAAQRCSLTSIAVLLGPADRTLRPERQRAEAAMLAHTEPDLDIGPSIATVGTATIAAADHHRHHSRRYFELATQPMEVLVELLSCAVKRQHLPLLMAVRQAFPSWMRSILTEIYLCRTCSCHEILTIHGNAWTGAAHGGEPPPFIIAPPPAARDR